MRSIAFFVALGVIGVLDAVWLGFAMTDFYKQQFSMLGCRAMTNLSDKWGAIIATYGMMAFGFALFVAPRCLPTTLGYNMVLGAAFGATLFGVYELTSYSVFSEWPLVLVWVDIAWGATMYALVGAAMTGVLRLV